MTGEDPRVGDLVFVKKFDVGFRVERIEGAHVVTGWFEWKNGARRSHFLISLCRLVERDGVAA